MKKYHNGITVPVVLAACGFVQAQGFDHIDIYDLQTPSVHYIGLDSELSFSLYTSESVENALIQVGFKIVSDELTYDENIFYFEDARPEFPLLTINQDIPAYTPVNFSETVEISDHLLPGEMYILVVTVESLTDIDGAESSAEIIEEDTVFMPPHAFAPGFYYVEEPDLPTLEVRAATLAGSHGYTLTASELPDELRINIELKARTHSIHNPIDVEFWLSVPGKGEFSLSVLDPETQKMFDRWTLESECSEGACKSLQAYSSVGAAVTVRVDPSWFSELKEGDIAVLRIQADPDHQIEQWAFSPDSNMVSLPIFIFNN